MNFKHFYEIIELNVSKKNSVTIFSILCCCFGIDASQKKHFFRSFKCETIQYLSGPLSPQVEDALNRSFRPINRFPVEG